METIMGVIVGVSLSAACGFRVFVPLLGMSIAHLAGHLKLSPGFEWIGSWPALIVFLTATVCELVAYFIPWIDNLMDVAATPTAIVAGAIVTASQIGEISPLLKWSLAAIAGGGASSVVQLGSVAVRAASSTTTGGLGNVIVAALEFLGSIVVVILAIFLPIMCFVAVVFICYKLGRQLLKSPWFLRLTSSHSVTAN